MSRPTLKPSIALFLTVVFLLTTVGDGFGASTCQHHDSTTQSRSAPAALPDVSGGVHNHGHAAADPATPGSHEHDAVPCTCIGGCLPGVAGPLPLPTITVEFAPAFVIETSVLTAGAAAPRASLLPHVLPFAQAPPAA